MAKEVNIWSWRIVCLALFLKVTGNFKLSEPKFQAIDIAWAALFLAIYGLGYVLAALAEGFFRGIKR